MLKINSFNKPVYESDLLNDFSLKTVEFWRLEPLSMEFFLREMIAHVLQIRNCLANNHGVKRLLNQVVGRRLLNLASSDVVVRNFHSQSRTLAFLSQNKQQNALFDCYCANDRQSWIKSHVVAVRKGRKLESSDKMNSKLVLVLAAVFCAIGDVSAQSESSKIISVQF